MVEALPAPVDYVTNPELEEGIKNGSVTTFAIEKRNLTFYQQAAIMSGFEVREIAKPGQHYVTEQISLAKRRLNGQENKPPKITAIKSQFQVGEGYVAISLKRPPNVTNDTAFHIARQKIQPK